MTFDTLSVLPLRVKQSNSFAFRKTYAPWKIGAHCNGDSREAVDNHQSFAEVIRLSWWQHTYWKQQNRIIAIIYYKTLTLILIILRRHQSADGSDALINCFVIVFEDSIWFSCSSTLQFYSDTINKYYYYHPVLDHIAFCAIT